MLLIPLADENPTRHLPFLTITLVVVNIAIFAYEASLPSAALNNFVTQNAFIPSLFSAHPFALDSWRRILYSMFLHGGWLHVGGNMLYLWIFGNNIEDRLGPLKFLGFYLVSGVVATLAQYAVIPTSQIPNLGASGAIAGCLGAYLLLYPRVKVLTLIPIFFVLIPERISALFVIGFWFVLQLLSGIASLGGPATANLGGVAFFAHVGGFIAGMLMVLPLWLQDRRPGATPDEGPLSGAQ